MKSCTILAAIVLGFPFYGLADDSAVSLRTGQPPGLGYSYYNTYLGSLLGLGNRLLTPSYVAPYYGYGYGYNGGYAGSSPFIGGRPVNPGPNPAVSPPDYQWVQYR